MGNGTEKTDLSPAESIRAVSLGQSKQKFLGARIAELVLSHVENRIALPEELGYHRFAVCACILEGQKCTDFQGCWQIICAKNIAGKGRTAYDDR